MATRGGDSALCEGVRDQAGAEGAVVVIYNGEHGNGFSAVGPTGFYLALPDVLRSMADPLGAGDRAHSGPLS